MSDRILHKGLKSKVMSAEAAAEMIPNGAIVGMSGFTGAGYPKAVPIALAKRAIEERMKGQNFKVSALTGASTGPELDQAMGLTEAISFRFPYNGDAVLRQKINEGITEYQDMHLSHAGSLVRYGYYGKVHFAVVEVTKVRENGEVLFSSSVGMNTAYLEMAEKIILEVNEWQDERLEGMHDVISVPGKHGDRIPIPILHTDDRKGTTWFPIDTSKVVAVVV